MTQNQNMNQNIEIPEWHIIQSFRYALPRQTYAAGETASSIRTLWPKLSETTRSIILKELREALERGTDMNSIDEPHWRELLETLETVE